MTNETTTAVSLLGAGFIAALPKLLDLLLGEKIARRRDEAERTKRRQDAEDAYALAVLAAAREDLSALRARNRELEDTHSGVLRGAANNSMDGTK